MDWEYLPRLVFAAWRVVELLGVISFVLGQLLCHACLVKQEVVLVTLSSVTRGTNSMLKHEEIGGFVWILAGLS